jgi:bacterioferritin
MDKATMIAKLNDCLRHEWTGVAQYAQAGFVVGGLWRQVYSGLFFGSADESFMHAKLVGDKISAMGAIPTVERNQIEQSTDVRELLELGVAFEMKAVTHYAEAIGMAEELGDRALVVFLEDILKQEQEGVDELTQLLREHDQTAKADTASKTG